jgi:uncharacterized membrane protein
MYKIIGGDGQEYGPVTDADLRKWIAEGRLSSQSLAKGEGDANFRSLSTFLEFAEALGTSAVAYGAPAPSQAPVDWSTRDYALDIGGCISRGWNLFANNLGILLGSTLLYILMIFITFAIVGGILGIILAAFPKEMTQTVTIQFSRDLVTRIVDSLGAGPLTGGLYYIFVRAMRGQQTGVGELFIGFQRMFPQLFLGYLIFTLTAAVCVAPFSITLLSRLMPLLGRAQHGPMQPSQLHDFFAQMWAAYAGSIPIFLICMVPTIYLMTNLQFVVVLIIDKEMGVWTAIKTSWRMVHKHWFTVFGLVFLVGLMILASFLLCCVGEFVAFAIGTAAIVYAYETIFGESRSA